MSVLKEDKRSYRLGDLSKGYKTETFSTRLAFAVFGFVIYTTYSVLVSAAQDALSGTFIPTSVIIIIIYVLFLSVALFLPYVVEKIPQSVHMFVVVLSMIAGMVLFAVASIVDLVFVRLAGVFVAALGQSLAEVGNVSLSALYGDEAMAWFSLGTGLGTFVGPLYFTGMTTLLCISPGITTMIISALPLAYLLMFILMDKRHYSQALEESLEEPIDYSKHRLSCNEKLALMKQNSRNVFTYALGLFSGYLSLSSIVTTLAFKNSPFGPRDHYAFYVLCFSTGDFIGRSYISCFSACKSNFVPVVKKTWILTLLTIMLGIFLGFAAWYRFLPSVFIVFALVFSSGICTGMLYINTILIAAEEQDFQSKFFSRGFSLIGFGLGVLLGTLPGLIVEPILRENCVATTGLDRFCFTRSMTGSNSTLSCLTH